MEFVGRFEELKFLEKKYNSDTSEFILVYGRRRLGKTMLLKESLKNKINGIYYLMTYDSPKKNLDNIKEILSEKLNEPIIKALKSDSWDEFFQNAIKFIPKGFIIIFDEIPYLFSQEKSIISQFQKIYDEYFLNNNIKLILCGSSLSIMDEIASHKSPLYGRRTGKIHLKPFTINETIEYLKIKNIEDCFKYHMIFNGVPYYLKQIDNKKNYKENIEELFFTQTTIFDDEVTFLLKEEFREIRNYVSILRAISNGRNTYSQINSVVDIKQSSLSAYLISLENLNLISQKRSFFDKVNSKKTRYIIEDNFLFIWFKVFEKYKLQLLNKQTKDKIITEILTSNLGFIFEKEVKRILTPKYEKLDSYFNKEGIEIDLIGKVDDKYDIFECKFQKNVNENNIIKKLNDKIKYLPKDIDINSLSLISIDKGMTLKNLVNM